LARPAGTACRPRREGSCSSSAWLAPGKGRQQLLAARPHRLCSAAPPTLLLLLLRRALDLALPLGRGALPRVDQLDGA
jgi:hypothetical protein